MISQSSPTRLSYPVSPLRLRKLAGFEPVVHLLADHGFSAYANTIEVHQTRLIARKP